MIKKIQNLWLKLSNSGNHHYKLKEQIRFNILINQGIMLYILIMILILFISSGIYIYLLQLNANHYWHYLFPYIFSELFIFVLLIFSFYLKNKLAKNQIFQILTFVNGVIFIILMALFLGWNSGIHFYIITLLPIPFFFEKVNKVKVFTSLFLIILVTSLSFYYIYHSVAYFPLPNFIEQIIFSVTLALILLSLIITSFFLIIRFKLAGKVQYFWRKISDYGNENFSSQTNKKYNTINNQFQLFYIFILLLLVNPIVYFLVKKSIAIDPVIYADAYWYFLPFNVEIVILYLSYFFKKKFYYDFLVAVGQISGVLVIAAVSLMIGKGGGFHYLIFAILPLPFFYYGRNQKKQIIFLILLSVFIFVLLLYLFSILPAYVTLPEVIVAKTYYFSLGGVIVTIIACTFYLWNETRITEALYLAEKKKSDDLLLNILPANIAEELKEKGYSKPVLFESVSVLFTDFVGFTKIAEDMSPAQLVSELDTCFSFFDLIIEKHNLEKLKTIGDSYMAASGVPTSSKTHAIDCTLAAIDISSFMQDWTKEKRENGKSFWQLRLGISSGPLVAGVIGEKKFVYDVWGDTVNVASRMETAGVSDKINISKDTYNLVKSFFTCEYRGKVKAKNKGNIEMYFVKGIRPTLSKGGKGLVPNERFYNKYDKLV